MMRRILFALALLFSGAVAFAPASTRSRVASTQAVFGQQTTTSTTALSERRWNFNEGQTPWGLKRNAEVWNGRVAQMAFVMVFLQEAIQGKGVIVGLQEGDPVNQIAAGAFFVTVAGLVGFLAFKGDDDYVK
mmetsp:Transcript_749/g.981  ORF Transcript_749/g.981 Transcript_749/m.981 type:complete len:132 (+) Transcript_749:86-481(+)|eukprot:CAMPEP_0198143094 /NCGR_PEP_ID=MMETSP1443-20131203/5747_1 /TAXON_ID=186043 /ORGANISM="Entomoneis sp., Strain CCMP2396" /LENGTH=131 /DNA_ID=CAMNT_0043806235 /DNA_START=59 /DNA_END=454 /DNA_ORIENTATION=-